MAKTRKAMKVKQPPADESVENDDSTEYEVEKIMDRRDNPKGIEYYVKWKGYPATSNSWEPAENILHNSLIKDFEKRKDKPKKTTKRVQKPQKDEFEYNDDEEAMNGVNDEKEDDSESKEGDDGKGEPDEKPSFLLEDEPVKAKRPRTASKATKKNPVSKKPEEALAADQSTEQSTVVPAKRSKKAKEPAKPKDDSEPKLKGPIKIKIARRVEPKAKKTTESKTKSPPSAKSKSPTLAKPDSTTPTKSKSPTPTKSTLEKSKAASSAKSGRSATRRNVSSTKVETISAKDTSIEDSPEDEASDQDKLLELYPIPESSPSHEDLDETELHEVTVPAEMELCNFKFTRLINESLMTKMVTFQGTYKGDDAIIRLEKTVFDEDAVKMAFKDKKTLYERDFANDAYSSYKIKPSESSSLNGIKATIVCPASESNIAKYSHAETILFSETPDVYTKVVQPFIDGVLNDGSDPNRWIYNILEGNSEADRVIMNDPDPDSGFILIPDLKWEGDEKALDLLAICHRRDLRSLRDLNEKHINLLKNILTKGTQAIKDKFKNVTREIRSYIHYQPSFYHFHVHFRAIDAHDYQCSDRDNLLGQVINNINLKKDYYKKTLLVYPLSKSHALHQELVKAKRI